MRTKSLLCVVLLTVFVLTAASHAEITKVDGGIEFTYYDPYAASVSLAGIFNNWNMNDDPMTLGDDGVWRTVIDLEPGAYEYKLVVNGSQWVADPDNPKTVGDYGNSQVTVGDDGDVATADAVTAISNTRVNSRVRLEGWYRASYDTESEVADDPTWRLTRPDHDVYISVLPTVTPQVTGRATLRFFTGEGEMNEITADLYDGHVMLEGDLFSVTGFYNEEVVQFDEPLELVGHADLTGTITEEHLAFGRGAQGMIIETDFWEFELEGVYASEYEADTYNDPLVYDDTGTDLAAARLTRPLGPVTLGATYAMWQDGWWVGFTGTNESPHLDEHVAETGSTSDWFELVNTDRFIAFDVDWPVGDRYGVAAEYALYDYESIWDMGNKEKVEGDEFGNGAIDIVAGDMSGGIALVRLTGSPLEPVDFQLKIASVRLDGLEDGEEYTAWGSPRFTSMGANGWGDLWQFLPIRQYTNISVDDRSQLTANVYAGIPEIDGTTVEFDADFGIGIITLGLEYDRLNYAAAFTDSVAAVVGYDELDLTATRFAGRARADIMGDRLWLEIEAETRGIEYDPDDESFGALDTFEAIFRGGYSINQDWGVILDVRRITYKDVATVEADTTALRGTTYDDESFIAPYVAIVYSPRPNIQFRAGYGVDPLSYIDTPVEGRGNGRERWRSQYQWE
ncbi:glycogen-binding domain-containing protein, partial [bacterium]|nr:glycogen-binding domain-containing protein [bacterium]